ncbi:MAG: hypothetical protein PUG87_05510 [Eubacteriales bacterium]|nr:hypothetical protein [Eubacteriales bacterium]MDY4434700.1 hypothetical protein [Candidatus Flemingibacterium sp.]
MIFNEKKTHTDPLRLKCVENRRQAPALRLTNPIDESFRRVSWKH